MEQRGCDFVKHCNGTAYAGFLDTIDDNLSKANEMGKSNNIVFMKGSDNFQWRVRLVWSTFGWNHGAQAAKSHRYWRAFQLGKIDWYKAQNSQAACVGKQQETIKIEFRPVFIVFYNFLFLLVCEFHFLQGNRFHTANVILGTWNDAILFLFMSNRFVCSSSCIMVF